MGCFQRVWNKGKDDSVIEGMNLCMLDFNAKRMDLFAELCDNMEGFLKKAIVSDNSKYKGEEVNA